MDRIDRHILSVLQKEGRLSTAELSERVGLSPSPCARRLKRLEDEGYIEDYQANLSREKVGIAMSFFVEVSLNNHQAESIEKFEEELENIEEVVSAHIVSGGYDYLLEVVSPNLAGYEAFTRKLHRITSVKDIHTHLSVRQVISKSPLPIFV
ncbi:putative Transcription regulator AsnC-type [Vibrio nigripulchritudo MADA3029]|uniref:Lrp/AsnC family transcriptional regulator n=1 Tax=Vibrio TaxID=662 RepID=UPI00021C0DDD|nr:MULTISPECIES: Lrp/AsnC family transcriptional regulator [Vibrio]EGU59480.1 transcriptional regulator [Vibrio nigripulchritudo ATCC 27043]UAB68927.1 Lrp/AsnC family transcriptional regulator [Vibrio sp. SCSIO 43132]CCN46164.1 putative Transcription regulator AsnC-type [Vibrio nigripulchritudo MADA3020]CCN51122.1 putative Transcription regulator AsnC-type [Vibrio nigripulchritudo MADA3021]CCN56905.1 putative Transcription regulator AsnC-type [Vibrio nigripulchritudo MADA3029]